MYLFYVTPVLILANIYSGCEGEVWMFDKSRFSPYLIDCNRTGIVIKPLVSIPDVFGSVFQNILKELQEDRKLLKYLNCVRNWTGLF